MEKFYLEIPTIERKEKALEYINEFYKYNSNINGVGGLDKALKNNVPYEKWVEEIYNLENEEFAKERGLVSGTTYFTIRESDNKIIGMVNFRHYLNESLRKVGGHIGYSIRPEERKKGYAKIQLYLTLLEAQKLGIDKVMVDCTYDNIGSEKTIIALGGYGFYEVYDDKRGTTMHNYWINVDDSINKYKDIYDLNIKRK